MVKAMYLQDGYSSNRGLSGWYRQLSVEEAKQFYGQLFGIDHSGKVREVRLNGTPKTWKTFPGCELSLKYGLRDCFRVGNKYLLPNEAISDIIVIPVKEKFLPSTPADIVTDWVNEKELKIS